MSDTEMATLTLKINNELLEMVVLGFLYGNSLIPDKHLALGVDLGLEVGEDGLVEVDILYKDVPQDWHLDDDFAYYDAEEDAIYVHDSPFEVQDED